MSQCLPESDLRELSESTFVGFAQRISAIPKDMCAPFYEEAGRLETELLMIHKFVVLCVRKEENLVEIANKWGWMVKICEQAAQELHGLSQRHPQCGAEAYYDKIIDLRAKCLRLQKMHS